MLHAATARGGVEERTGAVVGGVGAGGVDGCGIGEVAAAVCPLGTVVFGGTGGRVPLDDPVAGGGGDAFKRLCKF